MVIHHFDPDSPAPGGIDTCIRGMIRYGRGTDFVIVGMARSPHRVPAGTWMQGRLEGRAVPWLSVGQVPRSRPRVPNAVRLRMGVTRFSRPIRRPAPDVVQVHRVEMAPAARRMFPTAHLDLFVHEDAANWTRDTTESRWRWMRGGYSVLVDRAVRLADRVVCFSPSAASRLSMSHEHVLVVPTWFDPDIFWPAAKPPGPRTKILWVGRLETVKDPGLAVDVLAELPPPYELDVVGDGSLQTQIASHIWRRGLQDRIRLHGAVSKAEVATLMREHDVMLMTSHSEGFPRVMVEALASGLPVVATAGADPGELLADGTCGRMASDRSARHLAELVLASSAVDASACAGAVTDMSAPAVVARITSTGVECP